MGNKVVVFDGEQNDPEDKISYLLEPFINIFPRSKDKCFTTIEWEEEAAGIATSYVFNNEYVKEFSLNDKVNNSYGEEIPVDSFGFKKIDGLFYVDLRRKLIYTDIHGEVQADVYGSTKKISFFFERALGEHRLLKQNITYVFNKIYDFFTHHIGTPGEEAYGIEDGLKCYEEVVFRITGENQGITLLDEHNQEYTEYHIDTSDIQTDVKGMHEMQLLFTGSSDAISNDSIVTIEVRGFSKNDSEGEILASLDITLMTNKLLPSIDTIKEEDFNIWVYPGESGEESEHNGIQRLKYICNQVISRHKGISDFHFLTENGVYCEDMKGALASYLESFPQTENTGFYPYGDKLTTLGCNPLIEEYFSTEYGIPKDKIKGCFVDKRLLIGDETGTELNKTDGLIDLYENVVKVFQRKFVERAKAYVDVSHSWFSNASQNPNYKMGTITLTSDRTTNDGKTLPAGTEVKVSYEFNAIKKGDDGAKEDDYSAKLPFDDEGNPKAGEYQIEATLNGQKISSKVSLSVEDLKTRVDVNHNENKGNYAKNIAGTGSEDFQNWGMPYGFGKKDTLETHMGRETIDTGNLKNRSEYKENNDKSIYPGDTETRRPKIFGIDCSGFVENCLKEITFGDSNKTKIVPFDNLKGQGDFYTGKTERISRTIPTTEERNERIRIGDLFWNDGKNAHVAIAYGKGDETNEEAELSSEKETKDGATITFLDHKKIEIIHAYGNSYRLKADSYQVINTVTKEYTDTIKACVAKTVKSPFQLWSTEIGNRNIGRVYLWK